MAFVNEKCAYLHDLYDILVEALEEIWKLRDIFKIYRNIYIYIYIFCIFI